MKYKCSLLLYFTFIFAGIYPNTTYQRYEREKERKCRAWKEEGEKKEVQEKGQNTHYIMHTQYLARKNH
jgi:hypothetical protein